MLFSWLYRKSYHLSSDRGFPNTITFKSDPQIGLESRPNCETQITLHRKASWFLFWAELHDLWAFARNFSLVFHTSVCPVLLYKTQVLAQWICWQERDTVSRFSRQRWIIKFTTALSGISKTMAFSSLFHVIFLDKTKNRLCIVTINLIFLNKTKNRLCIVTGRFRTKTLSLSRLTVQKNYSMFRSQYGTHSVSCTSLWLALTQQARLSLISSSMSAHSSLNADSSSFCSAFLAPLRASLFAAFLHTIDQISG